MSSREKFCLVFALFFCHDSFLLMIKNHGSSKRVEMAIFNPLKNIAMIFIKYMYLLLLSN